VPGADGTQPAHRAAQPTGAAPAQCQRREQRSHGGHHPDVLVMVIEIDRQLQRCEHHPADGAAVQPHEIERQATAGDAEASRFAGTSILFLHVPQAIRTGRSRSRPLPPK